MPVVACCIQVTIDGKQISLEVVDTAGQEEFTSFRDATLGYGEGFLVIYSIDDIGSWENARTLCGQLKRVKDTDSVPIVVVGNKKVEGLGCLCLCSILRMHEYLRRNSFD